MIIDAHHHLWNYSPAQYSWIDPAATVLTRDFGPADILDVARPVGVVGSIVVQARQSLKETRCLLDLANRHDFLLGVVGWVPLISPEIEQTLDVFADEKYLKGLRHVVQDEPDSDFILGDDFNRGISAAIARGLRYDILIFERQLPAAIQFVDRNPNGRLVLDHIAKPRIASRAIEPWRTHIRELARRPNVVCKLSGIVTEAGANNLSMQSLRPYLDTVLEAFGPQRLMFGSDWPVCLLACEYKRWLAIAQEWSADLSQTDRQSIFCKTAAATYQLPTIGE
jgi:L-fuconolactonase